MRSAWPLTGRAKELAAISSVLTGVGDYAGVVLIGDAGVGKSRLAREALASISGRCDVRWVAATASGRALPLGAFAEWIRDAGSDPMALVQGVIQSLTASERGRPVALGVDDAHLLDDLSAFVVHQLVHRGLARLIVTSRSRGTPPEAITALWKDSYLQRVELEPLTRDQSEQLLEAVLGGPLDPVAAQRLWSLTRGNALFLRHLVEQEIAGGRLCRQRAMWSWKDEPLASRTLGELIDAQMGALSKPVGDVVELLAVGEPLDGEVLADVVGRRAVDDAVAKGIVALVHDAERVMVRLAHPMYGEVLRARAGNVRMRRLRGRILSALARSAVVDARDLIHRAVLLLDSDLPPDADLFTQAAGAAFQLLDPALAERLAGTARQIAGGYQATALHTFALHLVGQITEAERIFAEATVPKLAPEERSNLAMFRAGNLFWGLGLTGRAIQVLDEAETRIPSRSNGAVRAFRSVIEAADGSPQVAAVTAREVLASNPTDAAAMSCYFALTLAHGHTGQIDDIVDVAKHTYRLAERSFDVSAIVFGYTQVYLMAQLLAGQQAEAEAVTRRLARQTAEIPTTFGAYVALFLGQTLLGAGSVRAARQWLDKALSTFVRFENLKFALILCRSELVVAMAASGEAAGAAAELRALDAEGNPYGFLESRCALAAAWVCATEGATSEAVARAWRAADIARNRGHFAQEVMCLQTATRFGDATTAGRLVELCDVVEGPRVVAAAAHASALAAADADSLRTASEQLERMSDALAAADAAAQAAELYRARDRKGSALLAHERAERLAEVCGAVLPSAPRALDGPRLTARQHEVVALAARGLSNKEIAARLNLSVRSVESHRYRASKR